MVTNVNEIKFSGSRWGNLMKSDRKGTDLGEVAKKECIKIFAAYNGRKEETRSKYLDKGNAREEDAITLVSRVTETMYKKNSTRLENEFFSGEPDLFLGKAIEAANHTNDTKCSWSYVTYLEAKAKCDADIANNTYFLQGQCYMALTGAKTHTVSYCLVNGTMKQLNDEVRKLQWKWELTDIDAAPPEMVEKIKQIERNHIFDREHFEKENQNYTFFTPLEEWKEQQYDIPLAKRLTQITFDRDEKVIQQMIARAFLCRVWIKKNLM